MSSSNVTMPRWPAYLMGAFAAACAYPAVTSAAPEVYRALGQEPGWNLTIGSGRIDYVGDYGETRISVPRPDPRATSGGRRYEAGRLVLDVAYQRCNDAMSGHGYENQVTVTADGQTVRGCGGLRRTDWDV
jgi:heat shock protein HslJ